MDIPSTSSPHSFAVYETSRGARIFRLPLNPFPNFWGYAYLVQVEDLLVLIDAGSGYGDSNANLISGFEKASRLAGRSLRFEDLTHILITHGHIDHFGGLGFLKGRTKALVGIHELDQGILQQYEERVWIAENRLNAFLLETGLPEEDRLDVLKFYRFNRGLFHSVRVDLPFETAGMRVGPFEILHVPGHSPGHVAIRLHDHLFCGDHVLNGISPHQWPERLNPFSGLGHYFESLQRVVAWAQGVRLTLAGHNDPIVDLPARVQEIRSLHEERLQKVLAMLVEPHTIAEVSQEVFGEVTGYNSLLAIEEAGAHVEYLHQRGMLVIPNFAMIGNSGGPAAVRYQRVDSRVT